ILSGAPSVFALFLALHTPLCPPCPSLSSIRQITPWRPLIDIELDKGGKPYWFEVTEPSEAKEKRSYIKDFDNEILMSLILSNTNCPELVSAVLASNPTSVEDVNKQFSQNEGLRDASASVAAAAMQSSGTSASPSLSDAPCLLCDGNHSTKACYKLAIGQNAVKSTAKGTASMSPHRACFKTYGLSSTLVNASVLIEKGSMAFIRDKEPWFYASVGADRVARLSGSTVLQSAASASTSQSPQPLSSRRNSTSSGIVD
ncbi:hypothetical protein DL93DRAFT_2103676, partial [Clavulina sp. PMI_390]